MKRRRFLQIAAAGTVFGRGAEAAEWHGRALGAEAQISLRGGRLAETVVAEVRAELARIEATFSLHRPSELTRLNSAGCGPGSAMMRDVLGVALRVHRATGGAFEPSVQPLWQALAEGGPPPPLQRLDRVRIGLEIHLQPGQALTLNGIAQGYATDRIAALLARAGYRDCLVNIGEFAALGGDFRLGISDPEAGHLGQITLRAGRAVATSSPGAMRLANGQGHILGPDGQVPRWSTVTVEGVSAMLADAASTAFVLMDRAEIARARDALGLGAVRLVDAEGNLSAL